VLIISKKEMSGSPSPLPETNIFAPENAMVVGSFFFLFGAISAYFEGVE